MAAGPDRDRPGETAGHRWLRRGFVASLLAGLAGVLALTGRLLGHRPPARKPEPARFTAAELRSGAGVLIKGGLALVKADSGWQGLRLVCPHLGCRPGWDFQAKNFVCPCHGSRFAPDGTLRRGPARQGLTRLRVIRLEDGSVLIDPARPLESGGHR
jgi:nitrite reductase/ring-hydroxylating ferredoxin subunit